MKKPDFDYYRMVVSTQNDPDILQSELKDLINESVAYIEKDDGSKVPCSAGVMPNWIVAAQEPHPVGIEFIAYYGNGSKEKRVTCLNGIDLAVSLWLPLPELPEA